MLQTLKNAWNTKEIRGKILFTLFILLLYRIGTVIPVPFVEANTFASSFSGTILDYMNTLSGGALGTATLFALGVSPYINASIIIQLLAVVFPKLGELAKTDKSKMNFITRIVTVILAIVTAIGYYFLLKNNGALTNAATPGENSMAWFYGIVIVACYCAGASVIMWLAERINEKGIGNGISIILFINILSSVPQMIYTFYYTNRVGEDPMAMHWFVLLSIGVILFFVVAIAFLVYMTAAERRIKITYAKRVQGRKMLGGQSSDLPIKLNMTGVMPIIFAQSIVSIPSTIALIYPGAKDAAGFSGWWYNFTNNWFSYTSWLYAIIFLVLIIAFGYFYIAISFNPIEIANNLKKNGGFVRGIRPGKPTSDYIQKITNRITLLGSLFRAIVAIVPLLVNIFLTGSLGIVAFGGTSLLIVVGVALETTKELEAQLTTYRRPTGIFKKA